MRRPPKKNHQHWTPEEWQRAMTGRDQHGQEVVAHLEGAGLRIIRMGDPEQTIWLSLAKLDDTSGYDRFTAWCDEMHAREVQDGSKVR
jgi:hypothetical protein